MAHESWRHIVATTAGRPHSTEEEDILQDDLRCVLEVVPVSVIHILPEQLDWRLRAINLLGWHVEIVNEDHRSLVDRRTKDAFATTIEFGHDNELEHQ